MLDYDGCLPSYIFMTEGKQSDVKHVQYMIMPKKSVIVADRAYQDFNMPYQWNQDGIYFVQTLKDQTKYDQIKELSLLEGEDEYIIKDEIKRLTGSNTMKFYPDKLRRVVVCVEKDDRKIQLITNNFYRTASTIVELYKQRWIIEIFFKQLKQQLKIKSGYRFGQH